MTGDGCPDLMGQPPGLGMRIYPGRRRQRAAAQLRRRTARSTPAGRSASAAGTATAPRTACCARGHGSRLYPGNGPGGLVNRRRPVPSLDLSPLRLGGRRRATSTGTATPTWWCASKATGYLWLLPGSATGLRAPPVPGRGPGRLRPGRLTARLGGRALGASRRAPRQPRRVGGARPAPASRPRANGSVKVARPLGGGRVRRASAGGRRRRAAGRRRGRPPQGLLGRAGTRRGRRRPAGPTARTSRAATRPRPRSRGRRRQRVGEAYPERQQGAWRAPGACRPGPATRAAPRGRTRPPRRSPSQTTSSPAVHAAPRNTGPSQCAGRSTQEPVAAARGRSSSTSRDAVLATQLA